MMFNTFHITTLICCYIPWLEVVQKISECFPHSNVIVNSSVEEPPARERPGQDQPEQVQGGTSDPGGNTMNLAWHFFSIQPTSVYISHFVLSDILILFVIFLQWRIEEGQLGLQHRDEVIHQVGTEMSVLGSD